MYTRLGTFTCGADPDRGHFPLLAREGVGFAVSMFVTVTPEMGSAETELGYRSRRGMVVVSADYRLLLT
jgi:hypothetical protein